MQLFNFVRAGCVWRPLALLVSLLFGLNSMAPLKLQAESHLESRATTKSCLWEVSSSQATVFLLGSVHILKHDTYPVSPAAKKALLQSKVVVLEVDLDEIDSFSSQQLLREKGFLHGEILEDTISPKALSLVIEKTEELGLSFDQIRSFKPWLLMVTLTTTKLRKLGFDPIHGVDRYFFDQAKRRNKEILSLESIEYQLDRLDGMSTKTQELVLLQTLEELDVVGEKFDEILMAWSKGEVEALEALLFESFEDFPVVFQRLITDRNKNWMPKIQRFLDQTGTTLVVVGAAHLLGPEGVVQLLKNQGYKVKQL